jgi:hypothetical protein
MPVHFCVYLLWEDTMVALAEPNSSSSIVLEAQKLLNKSALQSKAPQSGAFDKTTLAAIKQYQIECGLRPTGVLDKALMDNLRKSANKPTPKYQVTVNGKVYLFTEAEHKQLINRIVADFRLPMLTLKNAVSEARVYWDNQNELKNDQYIVGWCIEAYSGAKLPPPGLIRDAETGVKACENALKSGNLKAFALAFPKAQKQANTARNKMRDYLAKIIDGGEGLATGLEIVSTTSFIVVGIIAAPVAASYGAGAITAGMIAGAGTSAVETLSHEVGKGISGQSKGTEDAALNVLRDTFIGGSIGALIKGKGAEKILAKVGPAVAKKLAGKIFEKASKKVVTKFIIGYFKKNGADILEGIMKECIKSFKSNAKGLTVDKFIGIVVKEVLTGGVFSKFAKVGDSNANAVFKKLSGSVKKDLIKSLGDGAKEKDLLPIFAKAFEESYKENAGKIYDKVLGAATGSETPKNLEDKILSEFATNSKLIARVNAEAAKNAKKNKKK